MYHGSHTRPTSDKLNILVHDIILSLNSVSIPKSTPTIHDRWALVTKTSSNKILTDNYSLHVVGNKCVEIKIPGKVHILYQLTSDAGFLSFDFLCQFNSDLFRKVLHILFFSRIKKPAYMYFHSENLININQNNRGKIIL